jgi:hypothetical protein
VAPLLGLSNVNVGVSYTGDYPVNPYGTTGDRPFQGAVQPMNVATTIDGAITGWPMAMSGGDTDDGMVIGLANLVGLPADSYELPLSCSPGRVPGGCWTSGVQRVIVLFTDDEFHNGPDPNPAVTTLISPYTGITPAPATWPEVLTQMRASGTILLFMNSNASGATSPGAPQYTRMLGDLGQPATDAYVVGTDATSMGAACDAVFARIHAIHGP